MAIGQFLEKYHIELEPRFENHDALHVLTHIGISLTEEIALKCYLLGNGRHSFYHFLSIFGGVLTYPTQYVYFKFNYQQGKQSRPFYHIDFLGFLDQPIEEIRENYQISHYSSLVADKNHSDHSMD